MCCASGPQANRRHLSPRRSHLSRLPLQDKLRSPSIRNRHHHATTNPSDAVKQLSPVLKPSFFEFCWLARSATHSMEKYFSTDMQPKLRLEQNAVALLTKNSIHQESFLGFERRSYNKLPIFYWIHKFVVPRRELAESSISPPIRFILRFVS